jgi:hypothetical protein
MLESTPMGRVYAHYFLDSLKRKSSAKRALLESVVDLDRVLQARTLREFDEAATAPLHGFPSAEEYYRTASSAAVVPNVRVPTLILHATDDPFLPPDAIPIAAVAANPWIVGIFPPEGGHVGFVGGPSPLRPQFWAEAQAARYFAEVLANE